MMQLYYIAFESQSHLRLSGCYTLHPLMLFFLYFYRFKIIYMKHFARNPSLLH